MISLGGCSCGSGSSMSVCCGPLLSGVRSARTAEELMRSRYTAYVLKDVDYLVRTTLPASRESCLAESISSWVQQVEWLRLHVISCENGGPDDSSGRVEFVAEYLTASEPGRHHERSEFRRQRGEWFYVGSTGS